MINTAPAARKRGRPARISRASIVRTALTLIGRSGVEDFMIKTLAARLGTSSMAIYNYFSSREALLAALGEEVCRLFEPPKRRATWQQTLGAWLWAIKRHADRYPMMPYVIGLKGPVSPGWVRLTAPVTVLLYEELALRGKPLALATYLFGSTASAMIYVLSEAQADRIAHRLPRLDDLGVDGRQARILRETPLGALTQKDIFDALIAQLIRGIESFLRGDRPRTGGPNRR